MHICGRNLFVQPAVCCICIFARLKWLHLGQHQNIKHRRYKTAITCAVKTHVYFGDTLICTHVDRKLTSPGVEMGRTRADEGLHNRTGPCRLLSPHAVRAATPTS
jgi:hypothetical protein